MRSKKQSEEVSTTSSTDGAEKFMERLIIFMDEFSYDMINSIKNENYEDAALYRDEIERVIKRSKKTILSKGWTKFNEEDLDDFLNDILNNIIQFWENMFSIEDNQRIYKE